MATEQVRMWRSEHEDRVLLMEGRTAQYAIEPRGEYVFGFVAGQPMRSRRGRERRLVAPGQIVAWDPSSPHSGAAVNRQPWSARLMVIEAADLATLAGDGEAMLPADVEFSEPVICDPQLIASFHRLQAAFQAPVLRLERDERLAEWLRTLIACFSTTRSARIALTQRDDRALRVACDYIGDQPARSIGLDELAAAAGIGKFRLVRLFRERTGLPPHAFQVARRVRGARRLLEAGETIAAAAAATGFADQSHMHRHFKRSLGVTPGEYQRRFTPPVGRSRRSGSAGLAPAGAVDSREDVLVIGAPDAG